MIWGINVKNLCLTAIIAGVILAILAPYGSDNLKALYRVFYWIGLVLAGGIGVATVNHFLRRYDLSPWLRVLYQSIGASLMVWVCYFVLIWALAGPPPKAFYYLTPFYIWVLSVLICGVLELMRPRAIPVSAQPSNGRPALCDRLKPMLRQADIYALSAEDHYVRVHTSKGEELILMRLSDAMREMSPQPGLQTHRSWWVAETGVNNVARDGQKLTIILQNGVSVPVSRSRNKNLRKANWI